MPSVRCPYCQYVLELKGAKPGKFQPKCPGCRKRFVLAISSDPKKKPAARGIVPKKGSTPVRSAAPLPEVSHTPWVESKPLPMPEVHSRLGGYHVLKKLGQGGMAAVYLAKQMSMDRNVALKVLSPALSSDPQFISRFTREAYAAAQITHHNVVQIHDLGVEYSRGYDTNFFSMEFVEGQTLAGLLKERGKLEPQAAVGYVLQAARGLKFAHDHGLIHRDIKPDNLLLDDHGVVKVADLGLVKRAGLENGNGKAAQISLSMGTPEYMPPEQARDAANVDGRADIYSLGCTLYDLLTGQPPFSGRTSSEVINKHATETATPPDQLAKRVPEELSFIVMKMMAKRPQDRYQTMSDVIIALESWLGVESNKPFSPKQEDVELVKWAAHRFNGSKWKLARTICILTFLLLSLAAIVMLALPMGGHPTISAGLIGFTLATAVVYQILLGISRGTFLLCKLRQLLFSSSLFDGLTYLLFIAVGILLLTVFDLHWVWLVFAIGATALAATFYMTIDIQLAEDRKEPLQQTEQMLKEMRLRGLDENSVRQFVCKSSGQKWEEFYETLFGFEAKVLARHAWGEDRRGKLRPRYGSWREPIIAWIEGKVRRRHEIKYRKMLDRLERKSLTARGIDQRSANRQARANARRVVEKASVIRETSLFRSAESALPTYARAAIQFNDQVRAISPDWMHDDARPADEHDINRRRRSYFNRRFGSPLDVIFGQGIRLVLALFILAGFAMWWNVNNGQVAMDQASQLAHNINPAKDFKIGIKPAQPLRVQYVPDWICDAVGSWNGGLIGVLLLVSAFFSGRFLGLLMLFSAALGLFGQLIDVPILVGQSWATAVGAAVLWIIGIGFFRGDPGI
jgi:tRNA A-37 threonylcarbamoyl transferase component Bud32